MTAVLHSPSSKAAAGILFVTVPLLFAANMLTARWLSPDIPPVTLALGRWLIVSLVLLPLVRPRRAFTSMPRSLMLFLIIFGGVLSIAPQYAAAGLTSATNVSLIFATTPMLIALMEWLFLRKAVTSRFTWGVALAFSGICITLSGGSPRDLLALKLGAGDLLAVLAVLGWAGYSFRLRQSNLKTDPLDILFIIASGGTAILLPFSALEWTYVATPHLDASSMSGLIFLALVAGLGAYLAWNRLIALMPSSQASMAMYLVPVYAAILGAVVLGEAIHMHQLFAAAIIALGVTLSAGKSLP